MITNIYSVYDKAVGAFLPTFVCRSTGEAIRSFMDACSDGKTSFCQHPDDFTLFHLGSFDDSNGVLEALMTPVRVISAFECTRNDAILPPVERAPGARPSNGS